ncbi:hypothetical protein GCM10010411_75990 [Actinomadura fulvescens]|uniref:HTH cro/C1-type domain-containing protein n=2 Tax=Actinomadura fulvescens TaxID=46160 RepID=A0ABP6CSX3_9ACTN
MSLAEKITFLFENLDEGIDPRTGKPYRYKEAAAAITDKTGKEITGNGLWKLMTGKTQDPKKSTLEGLAAFFEVEIDYFFDNATSKRAAERIAARAAERAERQAELLDLLEKNGVPQVHLRQLSDLSPAGKQMIAQAIAQTLRVEQLEREAAERDGPSSK